MSIASFKNREHTFHLQPTCIAYYNLLIQIVNHILTPTGIQLTLVRFSRVQMYFEQEKYGHRLLKHQNFFSKGWVYACERYIRSHIWFPRNKIE